MNKKKFVFIISLFAFLLLASAGTTLILIKKFCAYTKEALKDKHNYIIYQYLKPRRKTLFLDFDTSKELPVTFTPFL